MEISHSKKQRIAVYPVRIESLIGTISPHRMSKLQFIQLGLKEGNGQPDFRPDLGLQFIQLGLKGLM